MKEHFKSTPLLSWRQSLLPAVTRARRQRGMIVRHQKQQQAICKLPSWKYVQTEGDDQSSWTATTPRPFPYTRELQTPHTAPCGWADATPEPSEQLFQYTPKRCRLCAPSCSVAALPSSPHQQQTAPAAAFPSGRLTTRQGSPPNCKEPPATVVFCKDLTAGKLGTATLSLHAPPRAAGGILQSCSDHQELFPHFSAFSSKPHHKLHCSIQSNLLQ